MVIIQKRVGQLGNQLFAIAHFAAAAIEHEYKVLYPCFEHSLEHFPELNSNPLFKVRQSSDKTNRALHRSLKLLRTIASRSPWHECLLAEAAPFVDIGSESFAAKARKKLIACEGFGFRDVKSVMKHHRLLAELFSPSQAIQNRTVQYMEGQHLTRDMTLVGFHIRRSDYRTYRNGEYFYEDDTWLTWINQARAAFHSSSKPFVGVIFSDEDVSGLVGSSGDLIAGPGSVYEDLLMLSKCHYLVGPPSTFSGWASFTGRVPLLSVCKAEMKIQPERFEIVQW